MTVAELKALLERIPKDTPINRGKRKEIRKLLKEAGKNEGETK